MRRSSRLTGALAALVGSAAIAGAQAAPATVEVPDSVLPALKWAANIGQSDPFQTMHVAVPLKLRDEAGLNKFADAVSDPKSPLYRHFITPQEVGQRFGASQQDQDAVVTYLKSKGMTITQVPDNHLCVLADATVLQVENAFGTTMNKYVGQNGENTAQIVYDANSTPLHIPADLAHAVSAVLGTDTYLRPVRRDQNILTPSLARGCYNTAPSYALGDYGQGITIGYSNYDGYLISNAASFISYFHLPVPGGGATSNIVVVKLNGGNGGGGSGEGDLDLQQELSAAPLATIYIYDNGAGDPYGTASRQVSDNKASILSESYGWSGGSSAYWTSIHVLHTSMTTQGMSYFCASGDNGTNLASPYPNTDPEVLNVGGTIADVNSSTGARVSEVGWSGSGGGWSTVGYSFNTLPTWQKGTGVPTNINHRLVPDVALHSAGNPGAFYFWYGSSLYSADGTSFASPIFCGFMATLEQRLAQDGFSNNGRLGRMQDMIYAMNGRTDVWYDITSGHNGTLPDGTQSNCTAKWDFVTGWGAPNIDAFYLALAKDLVVQPASYTLVRGILDGGTLSSLFNIDQNYLVVEPSYPLQNGVPPIQIQVDAIAPMPDVSSYKLDIVDHMNTVGTSQSIQLYNWTTNAYDTLDTRNGPLSDTTIEVAAGTAQKYVKSGTNAIRAKITVIQNGPITKSPFKISVDQMVWKLH